MVGVAEEAVESVLGSRARVSEKRLRRRRDRSKRISESKGERPVARVTYAIPSSKRASDSANNSPMP